MATTNFPTSLDTISSLPNPGSGDITTAPSHASQHDVENDALRAIEAKVGIGASAPTANKVLRATGTGTTSYAQVGLTTDVTGILPVANGGTGVTSLGNNIATFLGTPSSANLAAAVTDETGTGVLVFNSSPTIVTPTIASFTNAQHNHSNVASGGQLTATAFANNAITGSLLATDAITIGQAQITSNFTSTATTFTVVTGLSVTVTVPTGGRRIKISVGGIFISSSLAAGNGFGLDIFDSTANAEIGDLTITNPGSNYAVNPYFFTTHVPLSGSRTYQVRFTQSGAGTFTMSASSTSPAFILVEAI